MHILDIVDVDNMVSETDYDLEELGADVCADYNVDKTSMEDWLDRNELSLKLIDMSPERVTDPWPGAAGTKLPLVLNAAMKASAEEFAEIMRGNELVQSEIFGKVTPEKKARSERVTKHMNHQFYHKLEDWEEDHDKLILSKNIIGTVHKKIFWADGKIQCVLRRNGVVINDNVEKIQDAPRVTDEIDKFWWQAEEKFRAGEWEEIDLSQADDNDFTQDDKVNRFLEQIRRIDLDEDGYPEPYIVTVHEKTKQVVRIEPNFTPESITFNEDVDVLEYQELEDSEKKEIQKGLDVVRIDGNVSRVRYVKYSMVHDWNGGYWDYGYGILLGPLNDNCNELINILLNSGHLANKGGGFINSGIKMGGGELRFKQNEWKKVQSQGLDLSRNIVPMPVKEPSQTLFSLLGLLMDVLRELSSVTEVMSGDQPKANMPAASIDMLIEQGKKMFNSVYKRHYRSLTKEQNAIFDLNFLYQDPQEYGDFLDLPEGTDLRKVVRADFTRAGMDVQPTANAEFSSKVQRMAKGRAIGELSQKYPGRVNEAEAAKMEAEAILDDTELVALLVPDEPNMTPAQVQQQMEIKKQEMMDGLDTQKAQAEAETAKLRMQEAQLSLAIEQKKAEQLDVTIPLETQKQQREEEEKRMKMTAEAEIAEEKRLEAEADRRRKEVDADKAARILPLEIREKELGVEKAEVALRTERLKPVQHADFEYKPKRRIQ